MPKPNYGFEKRQRELEKKRKKEQKALKKEAGGNPAQPDEASGAPADGQLTDAPPPAPGEVR